MLDILKIIDVLDEEEDITFTFKVKRSHLEGFLLIFRGISEVNEHVNLSIRKASNRVQAEREEFEKNKQERFSRIKRSIREDYEKEFAKKRNVIKAMKETRARFKDYWFLVREVQEELKIDRELEILRLHNQGMVSREIKEHVPVSAGEIRKVLARIKTNHPTPSPRQTDNSTLNSSAGAKEKKPCELTESFSLIRRKLSR